MVRMELLEYLQWKLNAGYISDLRRRGAYCGSVQGALRSVEFQDFSDNEWIDACSYLTDRKAGSARKAYAILTGRGE